MGLMVAYLVEMGMLMRVMMRVRAPPMPWLVSPTVVGVAQNASTIKQCTSKRNHLLPAGAEESRHARPHMFRGGEEGHGASESRHGKEAEARDVNTRKNKEYWRSEMFRLLPGFAARHDTDIEAKKAALQTL
eukprot:185859-Pelagomonas_calceolata.AAC.1